MEIIQPACHGSTQAQTESTGAKPRTRNYRRRLFQCYELHGDSQRLGLYGSRSGYYNFSPLLYISTDGGFTFNPPVSSPSIVTGLFISTSCATGMSGTLCTAAGRTISDTPILWGSTDGGSTWLAGTGIISLGVLYSTSCSTTTGGAALRLAGGQDYTTGLPVLYSSTDGSNWTAATTGISDTGFFQSTSCTAAARQYVRLWVLILPMSSPSSMSAWTAE